MTKDLASGKRRTVRSRDALVLIDYQREMFEVSPTLPSILEGWELLGREPKAANQLA